MFIIIVMERNYPIPQKIKTVKSQYEVLFDAISNFHETGKDVLLCLADENVVLDKIDVLGFVLPKTITPLGHRTVALLEARGCSSMNSGTGMLSIVNKLSLSRKYNFASPRTFWAPNTHQLLQLIPKGLFKDGVIVKPLAGCASEHISWPPAKNPSSLAKILSKRKTNATIVQEFISNPSGSDYKAYVIGDAIFGVKKPSPLMEGIREVMAWSIPETVVNLVQRIGVEHQLRLYGVDFVRREHRYYLLDVNPWPSYTGVRRLYGVDPAQRIAQLVNRTLEGRGFN